MQDNFAVSLFAGSYRICGYELQPLSAAHLAALEALENRISKSGDADPVSLLVACQVCSQPVVKKNGAYTIARAPKARLLDHWQLPWLIGKKSYFEKCLKLFLSYVSEYTSRAEKTEGGKSGNALSAPSVFIAVVDAISLGISEERAWSMPYGLLCTYLDVYAETQGADFSFIPDDDSYQKIMAEFDRIDAYAEEHKEELEDRLKWRT